MNIVHYTLYMVYTVQCTVCTAYIYQYTMYIQYWELGTNPVLGLVRVYKWDYMCVYVYSCEMVMYMCMCMYEFVLVWLCVCSSLGGYWYGVYTMHIQYTCLRVCVYYTCVVSEPPVWSTIYRTFIMQGLIWNGLHYRTFHTRPYIVGPSIRGPTL